MGSRRAGGSGPLRAVNELSEKLAQRGLGLVAVGMNRDVRTIPISVGAENEDSPTISNLLKGVTDCISTNNLKID